MSYALVVFDIFTVKMYLKITLIHSSTSKSTYGGLAVKVCVILKHMSPYLSVAI